MFGPNAGSIRDTGYTDILDRINLNGVNSRSLAGKKRKNKAWHGARLIRHVSPPIARSNRDGTRKEI